MEILILAADPVLPELLRRPLAAAGHTVEVAADPDAVETRLRLRPPSALFVPRRLRGADTLGIVRDLKSDEGLRQVAAIVVGTSERDAASAREVRADAFLRTPFTAQEVLTLVGATTRARKLILLADDSALVHRHVQPILEEAGFDVLGAEDGEEALQRCRAERPDLLITDVEMPRRDGFSLCKAVKQDAALARTPVVICSSLGEARDLEQGFDAGADDYLVKPVVPEELVSRVRQLLAASNPCSRERILVVDDSPAIRHLVADSLARQGFEVLVAENGRVGLERAHEAGPQMILTDYDMPEMNGFELVHALKRDPQTASIPVLMLTARDTRRDQAQMRAAGLTAYLVKPFSVDKCVAMVERMLAERRLAAYKEASRLYISQGAVRAAEIMASAGDLSYARAEERVMSVLFTDICSFTVMSSKMEARDVIQLLNELFDLLCPILKDEGADIDKFIGDCIMALFYDLPGRDPAPLRAVRAGLHMQETISRWNRDRPFPVRIRVGVNTGPLVRGDLGSRFVRRDFTVIGDTVNRANRYEANADPGSVLISESTWNPIKDCLLVEPRAELHLKGVAEPVTGYEVKAILSATGSEEATQ
jgi:DNA-binding response OmpR family regulator